jgi:acetyltransferase-like isoleucine patch superfamily enzyme
MVMAMHEISPSASIGRNATLDVDRLTIGPEAVIGDDTSISGQEAVIERDVRIGNGVVIQAEHFSAGRGGRIEDACLLRGLGGLASRIELGDRFFLGERSKLLMPTLVTGDYVSLHNHLLANGLRPCFIGHNTWVGQNCVLNSNDLLTIGNNVGIGAYTSVYTHGFFGELLEGCEVFNVAPVVIEDDAWLIGAYNVISPGVTVGRRAIVLTSSVVSHDVPPEHCVAGAPARDVTDRIQPFKAVTIEEKLALMRRFVGEYVTERHEVHEPTTDGFEVRCADGRTRVIEVRTAVYPGDFADDVEGLVYVADNLRDVRFAGVSVFDLSQKTYAKLGSDFEAGVISFMNSYRARFVPAERPRIGDAAGPAVDPPPEA